MAEYISLGHMKEINYSADSPLHYYLPHLAVLKENSTTTKLLVVFDAYACTTSGLSLNDVLMRGPKTQDELFNLLIRLRSHRVALIADVEKMYRQISVHPDDCDFQRTVWRDSPSEPIRDFQLLTVTYGTTSAPFAATRSLQQLAMDEAHRFPTASTVVLHDFYVDDLVSGAPTTEEAIKLATEISNLLQSGCMNLRKWISNDADVLTALHANATKTESYMVKDSQSVSNLGIIWVPSSDTFTFKLQLLPTDAITKRNVLAQVAKLFDPMGWLAPVIIKSKILIQDLWKLKIGWDDPLPDSECRHWTGIKAHLSHLEEISIPRFAFTDPFTRLELRVYSDASEKDYAAVVYARSINSHSQVISLLAAKTRVAPIKQLFCQG